MRTYAKKGSVLMEFIIVLPLYLILLGMTFLYGELSLHGINLAASADRTIAAVFGGEEWKGWNGYKAKLAIGDIRVALSPDKKTLEDRDLRYIEEGTFARPSDYHGRRAGQVADSGFRGSWSWLVGATVEDYYAMTPWTRGMVGTWAHLERLVNMSNPPDAVADSSVLGTLFGGGLGRVRMTGKDLGGTALYSYYTLTRNSNGRKDISYRQWKPGSLVNAATDAAKWYWCVYREPWPMEEVDYTSLGKDDKGKGDGPELGTERQTYQRYGQFVTWSE